MIRLIIATIVGLAVSAIFEHFCAEQVTYQIVKLFNPLPSEALGTPNFPDFTFTIIKCALNAPGIIAAALVMFTWRRRDSETRCRKCQYTLRGITEPRCPECGERI